jgi:hypothetical protein
MTKLSKRSFIVLMSTMLAFACNSNIPNVNELKEDNSFSTKNVQPSSSPDPNFKLIPPSKFESLQINQDEEIEKINFDYEPPDNIQSEDNQITVVYKDPYKVRLDKKAKKLKVKSLDEQKILDILDSNEIIDSKDLADNNLTDKDMDDLYNKASKERSGIPHLQSIHYYKFSKSVDVKKICKELKKNPLVRLAYPTPKIVTTATISALGSTTNTEANPSKPNDPAFGFSENTHWYWFNKHRIFKAWNLYGSTAMPNIAVIDSGFNVNSSEINIGDVYHVKNGSLIASSLNGNCPNKSCAQELLTDSPTQDISHGSMVASIAGGKKNNSLGLSGVAPGATITAIKASDGLLSVAKAIELAGNNTSVDVINISQAIITNTGFHYPLSQDSTVNAKITYAVLTKNKPVVITIGNNELNPYNNPLVKDSLGNMISPVGTDGLVIGGSEPSSIAGKQKAWVTDDPSNPMLKGSNFNISENTVSLTASAYDIYFMAFKKSQGTDIFTSSSGTSCSAPMISATLGMMRKLNSNLSAKKLQGIIVHSSNLYKYSDGYGGSSNKFLGRNLNSSIRNEGLVAGIRDLNTYNALVIAKNFYDYDVITRSHNIDDYIASNNSSSSSIFPYPGGTIDSYGSDVIYGFDLVNNYSYFNFSQYNGSGGCTYGYQVYRNTPTFIEGVSFDSLGGVSGVASAPNCNTNNWNSTKYYYYN